MSALESHGSSSPLSEEDVHLSAETFVRNIGALRDLPPAISIFGSSRTPASHPLYKAAFELGGLFARAGFAVITGGGPGIMEAANKGCTEAHGRSVGFNIALTNEQLNSFVNVPLEFEYFYTRKLAFVHYSAAFVFFPGGFGTLDEFFEFLTLMQTGKASEVPVLLFGSTYWAGLNDWMKSDLMLDGRVGAEDLERFLVVDEPDDALVRLRALLERHTKPG